MKTDEQRFYEKVEPEPMSGCHLWASTLHKNAGYGYIKWGGRPTPAHRVAWELAVGPIPAGLVIDHLCRNRACVNPDHLRVVTTRENLMAPGSLHPGRATHCPQGHEYSATNTRHYGGRRSCRTCHRERVRSTRKRGLKQ